MDAEKKIQEAEYFLNQLRNIPQDSDEFMYNLSAFLNAWRSVLDVMLYDYAEKFVLGLTRDERITERDFEVAAKALQHTQALQFIKWWRQQRNRLMRNPLWKKRIIFVHRGYPPMTRVYTLYLAETIALSSTFTIAGASAEATAPTSSTPNAIPPSTSVSSDSRREIEVRFRDIPDRNIIDICDETFKEIREIFEEASQRFGM